jgi:hypothetical protein
MELMTDITGIYYGARVAQSERPGPLAEAQHVDGPAMPKCELIETGAAAVLVWFRAYG